MDQHGANEPKGGLLIWTSMCPMNQKGGLSWPQFSSLAWTWTKGGFSWPQFSSLAWTWAKGGFLYGLACVQ